MTFKEFKAWCNARACDGAWGLFTALACSAIIKSVSSKPFWKREKEWRKIDSERNIVQHIVQPINKKLEALQALQP